MTRDRDFKSKVRARMAKTGERYAAARASLTRAGGAAPATTPTAPVWQDMAGVHAETTGLRRLATAAGWIAPHTGQPASEALLLGLGGGLGGAYFVFAYKGMPPTFYVASRCYPQYAYGADFVRRAARRIGLPLTATETTSRPAAARQLAAQLERGPALLWVDRGSLPWAAAPLGSMGAMPHVVVAARIDGDQVELHDRSSTPHRLAATDLASARSRLAKEKNRMIAAGEPEPSDLASAVTDALADCAAELAGKTKHKQLAGNFGITGLAKWAELVNAPRAARGWPKLFSGGVALWNALTWGHYWIEHAGTGGGGFRPLYAAFLDEAAVITGRRELATLADDYRQLGRDWSALAAAMLPTRVDLLGQTRDALGELAASVDAEEIARASEVLTELRRRAAGGEIDADAAEIRADLASRLAALVEAETAAARALARR